MSEHELVEIAQRQINSFNESDWDAMRLVCAEDVLYDEKGAHRQVKGIEDFLTACKAWKDLMMDCHGHLLEAKVCDNWVIAEFNFTATMTGDFTCPDGSIVRANGKKIENPSVCFYLIENGRVVEMRHYFDMLNMMTEFGIVK